MGMELKSEYVKVASYEGKKGEVKKVVLLYSGGLDTSTMIKWIFSAGKDAASIWRSNVDPAWSDDASRSTSSAMASEL